MLEAPKEKQKPPLGCWIIVYPRGQVEPDYRNHYLGKRLVTSEDFHGNGVPHNFFTKVFGIDAIRGSVSTMGEGVFFLGKFYQTFRDLKREMSLNPALHVIKIAPANECRFPKRLFQRKGFKEYVEAFAE